MQVFTLIFLILLNESLHIFVEMDDHPELWYNTNSSSCVIVSLLCLYWKLVRVQHFEDFFFGPWWDGCCLMEVFLGLKPTPERWGLSLAYSFNCLFSTLVASLRLWWFPTPAGCRHDIAWWQNGRPIRILWASSVFLWRIFLRNTSIAILPIDQSLFFSMDFRSENASRIYCM